ncbi:hypothetical protein [Crossiella sp. CA198]|uniref:hypothetical protein n=1 Tax=Crossiella sp. CA198 TaxID=3455607 RepID=UPI003F8D726E
MVHTGGEPPADRAAFREFVRRHHPDVGGDPVVFAAGVEEYRRRQREQGEPVSEVDERFDGPVEFVVTPRGIRGIATRIGRWRARRRRPPRVS